MGIRGKEAAAKGGNMDTFVAMAEYISGSTVQVDWNGSVTFNVSVDGRDIDCRTLYSRSTPGGACTKAEAEAFMHEILDEYRDAADSNREERE